MEYADFVARKMSTPPPCGIDAEPDPSGLFPFQHALVRWAVRRGRCAIFAGTGLGKTRMQVRWADTIRRATDTSVLTLAPLAVAEQTSHEGAAIGVGVRHVRSGEECDGPGIYVTNYERLHRFDASDFGAVVLDESSIIKHHDAKTLRVLMDAFGDTPYRACFTATPAPNDWTELGTHAEFLGICTRSEMLSEYFCHDGGETQVWRLKGHARQAFWRWVASWGAMVAHPRDLGMDQPGFDLPPLRVHGHVVRGAPAGDGFLFHTDSQTLMDRRRARKASINARVSECAAMVNADREPWVVWCDLNDESDALAEAIPDAVEVRGSMDIDAKESALDDFGAGRVRVLVTKPSIAGFGLNWQHCARVAFVGVTDSWEAYYQAVRRCWRFGQTRPVDVHVFSSEAEGSVVANLARKDDAAAEMQRQLAAEVGAVVRSEVLGHARFQNEYNPKTKMEVPEWLRPCEA